MTRGPRVLRRQWHRSFYENKIESFTNKIQSQIWFKSIDHSLNWTVSHKSEKKHVSKCSLERFMFNMVQIERFMNQKLELGSGLPSEGDHHLIDDFYVTGQRNFMPPLHLEPGSWFFSPAVHSQKFDVPRMGMTILFQVSEASCQERHKAR